MNELNKLLDKIKETRSLASDNALAVAVGVSRQRVSAWRHGTNLPDPVACATIAGLTGEPLAKVLGVVGEARAISREEKTVWRKLAASVAVLVLAMSAALPGISQTQKHEAASQETSNRHYAKINGCGSKVTLSMFCHSVDRLRGNTPSPANKRPFTGQQSPAIRTSAKKTPGQTKSHRQLARNFP